MKHPGFIAVMFIIGCATGGVASQLVVPPARAGTTPTRWEHFCGEVEYDVLTRELNKVGAEGWEVVSVTARQFVRARSDLVFCAKRALP